MAPSSSARHDSIPMSARTPVPVGKQAVSAAMIRKLHEKAEHERNIASALLASVVGIALLLLVVGLSTMVSSSAATTAIVGSFGKLRAQQSEFRMLNSRFATWPELASRGAALPISQTVRTSNADASHWFLSIIDRKAGVICDGTGELIEGTSGPTPPVCRSLGT